MATGERAVQHCVRSPDVVSCQLNAEAPNMLTQLPTSSLRYGSVGA